MGLRCREHIEKYKVRALSLHPIMMFQGCVQVPTESDGGNAAFHARHGPTPMVEERGGASSHSCFMCFFSRVFSCEKLLQSDDSNHQVRDDGWTIAMCGQRPAARSVCALVLLASSERAPAVCNHRKSLRQVTRPRGEPLHIYNGGVTQRQPPY